MPQHFVGRPTADRGKSATAAMSGTTASTFLSPSAHPHTHCTQSTAGPAGNASSSPLKIESVLPTVLLGHHQQRQIRRSSVAKSMYRSYSTLSSAYFKKSGQPGTGAAAVGSAVTGSNHQQLPVGDSCIAEQLQQTGQPNQSANGFWRVQRTAKEKEKLPDRINLDRRGLTALPVIEDEPGLRLLSLQHNLINSFSVPAYADAAALLPGSAGTATGTNSAPAAAAAAASAVEVTRKSSAVSAASRNLSTRNLFNNSQFSHKATAPSVGVPTAAAKSSALLHVKDRINRMKKSSSFIGHGCLALGATGRQQRFSAKLQQLRALHPTTNASFSTDSGISDAESGKPVPNQPVVVQPAVSPTTTITPLCDALIVRNEAAFVQRQHLESLVFIDLYDNQIEKISNLDGLQSLTVLLLGKNRIRDIAGLSSVRKTLRVLDLHGNRIVSLAQKICQLQELKSLNLAGNSLRQVHADDFRGLINLRELNLKRNRIKRLAGFEDLRSLERLWLCHNDVQRVEDMASVATAIQLREVTIENNPVSLGGDCVSFLVSYLPALQLLSQMPVTEQVRRAAQAWRRNKETTDANYSDLSSDVCQSMRREEIISNARTNWELLRGQQQVQQQQQLQKQLAVKHASRKAGETSPTDGQSDLSEGSSKTGGSSGYGVPSENLQTADRSFTTSRQKAISTRLRELKKASIHGRARRRSVSQDNYHVVSEKLKPAESISISDQQLFRLPPILAPFLNVNNTESQSDTQNQSESSVGPNVDSSSSYVSSDNETTEPLEDVRNRLESAEPDAVDADAKQENMVVEQLISDIQDNLDASARKTPNLPENADISAANSTTTPEKPLVIPTPLPQPAEESSSSSSTISTISSNASSTAKTPSTTASSAKCRSAIGMRRIHLPLARAQTARHIAAANPQQSASTAAAARLSPKPSASSSATTASSPASSTSGVQQPAAAVATVDRAEREREQGGDYLIEICGRYLNVYGAGAVKFIDRQWNSAKAADVHTLQFSYVHFNIIAPILGRIKQRFPNAENFVFRETSINALGQLNALADVQGIQSLVIEPAGNGLCDKRWRHYAIYRLSHWGVRQINGEDVRESDVEEAQRMYEGLSDLVLWSLPEAVLDPLLVRLRLEETCSASRMTAKQWLWQADAALRAVVGKEALQVGPVATASSAVGGGKSSGRAGGGDIETWGHGAQRGKRYLRAMMVNTCDAAEKLQALETLWPTMLMEIIRNTLLDYAQLDVYVRNQMLELAGSKLP